MLKCVASGRDCPVFNPSRLTLARVRRGLTKKDLAERVGVTLRSFSRYEAGAMQPPAETLEAIAKTLAFPMEFFSAPTIEAPNPESVSFRAMQSMTASQRNAALGAAALALELSAWISERFATPEPDVPDLRGHTPEAAADALRAAWQLGERPIKNLVHLLEQRGVRVFSLAEQNKQIDAFSFWRNGTPCVFLNTVKSAEHGRFDAAHELGHLVLHRHGGPTGRGAEHEADQFASCFLMPRASVLAAAPRSRNIDALVRLKPMWIVSVAALNYRLRSLDLLTEWEYRLACIEIQKRGFRLKEPAPAPRETSQVLQKVFQALRLEGIGRADVAHSLHIDVDELDSLVFGLVMRRVGGGATIPTPRPTHARLRKL